MGRSGGAQLFGTKLRRLEINWEHSAAILKSPVLRSAALLPLIGYLILLSESVATSLKFVGLDRTILFETEVKLHLLYYGGVLVLLSLFQYWIFCPQTNKRFANVHLLRDKFVRSGSIREVGSAVREIFEKKLDRYRSRPGDKEASDHLWVTLDFYASELVYETCDTMNQSVFKNVSDIFGRTVSDARTVERELHERLFPSMSAVSGPSHADKRIFLDVVEFLQDVALSEKSLNKSQRMLDLECEVLAAHYWMSCYSKPRMNASTLGFALLGGLFLSLPALDTLLSVFWLDLSRLVGWSF